MSRFLAGWLKKPLMTGAIFPSSVALGRQMAGYVPLPLGENEVVLELGPGTGVVTRCLLERGIPENKLVLLEYSAQFCKLLHSRLPEAHIVQSDAYAPGPALAKALDGRTIRAVVSSLPLMTRPDHQREAAISTYLTLMQPGGRFIQFTYARRAPVLPERINARMEKSNWIKLNLPPARILVYHRDIGPDPALST
ncbi:methyltransferase domain-containing protein [Aureimonas fodinaquatilis]|uniref:Methyltransferase domain-containing protein n=2 Tax=Aureimonas fodinaquatilis TaxID=2565783 RepID=A0A5B0DTY6_9HYPH|nr:methyltransferase domain-containing protein [Aureimonas fodinaquatilis]